MAVSKVRVKVTSAPILIGVFIGITGSQLAMAQVQPRVSAAAVNQTPAYASGAPMANGQPVQPQNLPLAPPFILTAPQQAALEDLLAKWEKKNDSIQLFKCAFHRWEYDPAFTMDPKQPKAEADGEVEYAAPDKGLFHDLESWDYTQNQKGEWQKVKAAQGMYWTCDGNSIYEVSLDPKRKVITEKPLPPELRGKAISEGPLPFVFGAKAATLKARYFLRIAEDPVLAQNNQVLLQAYPKWQKDAGNFSHVELILDSKELLPIAIQIFNPGANIQQQSRTVIKFDKPSINNPWTKFQNIFDDFSKPNLFGYKHEVEQNLMPPPASAPGATGGPGGVNQAQRPQAMKR